jgi:NAD+ kinase
VIVSIGGDGTMLAALRAAMAARRPVLGVACGSLGALTSVEEDGVENALERFCRWEWVPRRLPALEIRHERGDDLLALNDIVVVRGGQGQIRTRAELDGVLYGRFAGDGCIVSTPIGSSAYTLAAGGPLMAPGADVFVLTHLPTHGGLIPPLVIGGQSRLTLITEAGYGGARVELDGQVTNLEAGTMDIALRAEVATVVTFADQEPLFTGLRRRGILMDSPRIVADERRD